MSQSAQDNPQWSGAGLEARAVEAEARVRHLEAELARTLQWWRTTLIAVVVVALIALLILGLVAFNAVDDSAAAALRRP